MPTEKILTELVLRTAQHFHLNPQDALATVAMSRMANELSEKGNCNNLSIDELTAQLLDEISKGV